MLKKVGRYELVQLIGEGGMGAVYKAFDPLLHRHVAVKLIAAKLDDRPEARERFFREARAAGQLSHHHIVTIFDLGEEGGQPYLAMEYLSGSSLATLLARGTRLSVERAIDLMVDVCSALEYAHERGVVHRDIKPANLFLTDAGEVKIVDFGLAHLVSSELTRSEMILGTANYMSPEQVRGERVDRRADIFAAGAVLYEVLTGHRAFDGDTFATTLYKVLESVPEPVHTHDPSIPPPLAAVVERALAKRRDDRYPTAGEMMRELTISREALNPMHRYAPALSSMPTVLVDTPPRSRLEDPAPGVPAPARSTRRPEIMMPLNHAEPQSVAWSPRRLRTTAMVGIVLAVAGGALLLTPDDNGRSVRTPAAGAPAPAAVTPPEAPTAPPQPAAPAVSAPAPAHPASEAQTARVEPPPAPARRGAERPAPPREEPRPAPQTSSTPDPAAVARADEALARLAKTRALAEAAGAPDLARAPYRAAIGIDGEVARLYAAGEFARAAIRADDAASLYRGAEEQARAEAAEQERARTPAPVPPLPQAAEQAPVRTEQPQRSAPPAPPAPDPRESIRGIVGQYVAALQGRNIAALKAIWPSLGGTQERAIRAEFDNARSVQVQLADQTIAVTGDTAVVTAIRGYELMTVDGHRLVSRTRMTMRLRRRGETWAIESVAYEQ